MSKSKRDTSTAYGEIFKQAREPVQADISKLANTETRESVHTETRVREKLVTMTISTPKPVKDYWIIEARKRGTTVSAMVKGYLESELGMPD